ncbi:MAG: S-layer homology domain-containing protein [Clostridia bacterium]|nr:S-layer homology domain-containing protein [Clostridia bacterium]
MKKILCILLCLCCLSSFAAQAATEPSEWAKAEIDSALVAYMEAMQVDMDYQRNITRKEFCYLALEFYNRIFQGELGQMSIANPFTDVNDPYVLIAYELGIIQGVSDTLFAPDAAVTRQEICVMLVRVIRSALLQGITEEEIVAYAAQVDSYSDAASVAEWARGSVGAAVSLGIMNGMSATELGPNSNCTIEQALILIKRACEALV